MPYYDKSSANLETISSRIIYEIKEVISKFNKSYFVASGLHGSFIESQMRKAIVVSILNRYPKVNSRILKMIIDAVPAEYSKDRDNKQSLNFDFYSSEIEDAASALEFSELDELYMGFYGHHFVDTHWRNMFGRMLTEIHNWVEFHAYKELIDHIRNNTVPMIDSHVIIDSSYKVPCRIIDYTTISLQLMETISSLLKSKLPRTLGGEFVLNVVVRPNVDSQEACSYSIDVQLTIPEVEVNIELVRTYTNMFVDMNSVLRKELSKHRVTN